MAEEGSIDVIDDGKPGDTTDWKAEARKWEARAKAEKLDSELKAVKAKAAHDEAVAKVAKETGVPASIIKGVLPACAGMIPPRPRRRRCFPRACRRGLSSRTRPSIRSAASPPL